MDSEELKSLISKVFAVWVAKELHDLDFKVEPEELSSLPFNRFLLNRLKDNGVEAEVPDEALLFITLVTDSNPGIALVLMKKLLELSDKPLAITALEALRLFPEMLNGKMPCIRDDVYYNMFYGWWEEQKDGPLNLVDTEEYWKTLVGKEE